MHQTQLICSYGCIKWLNTMKIKLNTKNKSKNKTVSTNKSQSKAAVKSRARERKATMKKTKKKMQFTLIKINLRNLRLPPYNQRLFKKILRKRNCVNRKMLRHKLKREQRKLPRVLRRLQLKLLMRNQLRQMRPDNQQVQYVLATSMQVNQQLVVT